MNPQVLAIANGSAHGNVYDEHGNPIKDIKRHPTLEDDVIVYAGATILGGDTVIGRGSVIGSNVWLIESVPPGSQVVQGDVKVRVRRNEQSQ